MDSSKNDAIKKVFGAAAPQRTYEQHFGRTAGETGAPPDLISEDSNFAEPRTWQDSDLALVIRKLTQAWGDLPGAMQYFGIVLLHIWDQFQAAEKPITDAELNNIIAEQLDAYNEYLAMREEGK